MQREMWVGFAWAGGVVVAMVSVFFYGLTTYEPAVFEVTWDDREHEETVNGATLAEDDQRRHDFLVPGENITSLRIVLEWDDPVGPSNDEFELSLTGPDGVDAPQPARGKAGSIQLSMAFADPPTADRAEGASGDHALEQIERPDDPWEGDAAFAVTVRLVSAPGTGGTQDLGLDPQADGENDYVLRLVRVMTDATLTPIA